MRKTTGFVLAGGASTRMGRDKALLLFEGSTLLETIARRVKEAAGSVTVIGPAERYRHLPVEVIPDQDLGKGPLGGVYTALSLGRAEWNLIVACDMPNVTVDLLRQLLSVADRDGVVPETPHGLEPLCAVYQRRVALVATHAIAHNQLKMQDFVSRLDVVRWPAPDPSAFANWNVPEQVESR